MTSSSANLMIALSRPVAALAFAALAAMPLAAQHTAGFAPLPDKDYLVYVASEATDKIALVRFGPKGARVDHQFATGLTPTDVAGPHGLAVSPDGKFLYVSTAHGTPYGSLWKYRAGSDEMLGRVELGNFPATAQVTPDGEFVYVVNFNLHGEMVPSSVSVVATDGMVEVARITTCIMPHGSRINSAGTRQYSACMMDDMMVEIDTRSLAVARRFALAPQAMHDASHETSRSTSHEPVCSPTWAQPSSDGARIWVACNKSNEIVEIDAAKWTVARRIPAGDGVYNLATTHDGALLVATNKRGKSVSIFDAASGEELARLATKRRFAHGVAISPDDRYAFISVEGYGSEPGTVEVIDLKARRTVATIDVGQQAGGIDVWKTEP